MGITFLKLVGGMGAVWAATKMVLEWTGEMDFIRGRVNESAAWAAKVYSVLSAPSQPSTLLILSVSVGLFGLLVFVDHQKARTFRYLSGSKSANTQRGRNEKDRLMAQVAANQGICCQQLQREWEQLEEGDREIIREMVLKGGLMESDITALLKVRGFIQYDAAYEPIAERVSFIHCDYTGYHSIVQTCQSWLCEKIHEELRCESFSEEIR